MQLHQAAGAETAAYCHAGMVALLQIVLQMYSGQALQVESDDVTEAALNEVLLSNEATWGLQVRARLLNADTKQHACSTHESGLSQAAAFWRCCCWSNAQHKQRSA